MIEIQVNNLVKSFEVGHNVLDGVTFQIDQGQRVGLLGKNGAGKSTLFKILIGELDCDEGTVTISPGHRMGLISQIPVYPEGYTVDDVLRSAFGRLHALTAEMEELAGRMAAGETDPAILKRYGSLSERFEVFGGYDTDVAISKVANGLSISDDMRGRLFDQLSGGEKTRVNLGRLILEDTDILLLDEPLSNLDAKLRVEMQVEIKRIQKELGITTIIVTHDHEEAVSLADRVIVMNAGHILQIGKPQEVFDRPASPFIADFMGFSTFLHGIAAGAEGDMRLIRCGAHTLQVPAEAAQELTEGDACILAIRSENIRTAEQEGVNTVRGTVKSATYKGHTTRLEVSGCFEEMVYPAIHEYADVQEGSEVLLHFPAQHFCVYKDIK